MKHLVSAIMVTGIVGGAASLAVGYRWLGGGLIICAVFVGEVFRRKLSTLDLMDLGGTGSIDQHSSQVEHAADSHSYDSGSGNGGDATGD